MSDPHALAIAKALTVSEITGNTALHTGMKDAEIRRNARLIEELAKAGNLDMERLAESVTKPVSTPLPLQRSA